MSTPWGSFYAMGKLSFIMFSPYDWMNDTRELSPEAKGVWIDLLCLMWNASQRGVWKGTHQQLARATGCEWQNVPTIVRELARTVATAIFDDNETTLTCRRMVREDLAYKNKLNRDNRYRERHKNVAETTHKKLDVRSKTLNNNNYKDMCQSVLDHFNTACKKSLKMSPERMSLIERRLASGRTVDEMRRAIDNFSRDEWSERRKFMDLVYVIGVRNKVDNLDKWINHNGPEKPKLIVN